MKHPKTFQVFSITCGQVELDGSQLDADMKEKMLIKWQLSSKDKLFEKIRNKHFASIFSSLSAYAKQLKQHQVRPLNVRQRCCNRVMGS